MLHRIPHLLAIAAFVGACGTTATGPGLQTGLVDAPPSARVLPSADPARAPITEQMQFAWILAEESLGLPDPVFPARGDAARIRAWADRELTHWLERKSHTVEAARRELDTAAEETHHQRIMAGALVGLLYEDVARVFEQIPVPEELVREPEIAAVYRDVLDFQASPYREHARRAYEACAANAIRPAHMRHWGVFCAGRAERLPPQRGTPLEEGTVVTVVVEP